VPSRSRAARPASRPAFWRDAGRAALGSGVVSVEPARDAGDVGGFPDGREKTSLSPKRHRINVQ
jgi:hypothetical protein